jgi:hypothetical protein
MGCELTFDLLSSRLRGHVRRLPELEVLSVAQPAPAWVSGVVDAFAGVEAVIDSRTQTGVSSDAALAAIRPALVAPGFAVEASKSKADKITRPVLFGEQGSVVVQYDVDGFHPEHGPSLG